MIEGLTSVPAWWLTILLLGLATLPIANLLGSQRDNGYAISKPLGILLLTTLTWLTASIQPAYGRPLALIVLAVLALTSLSVVYREGLNPDWNEIVRVEVLFTMAFLAFVLIRAYSPEIYFTYGEKFMDHGFTAAILRSNGFPPMDPWYAGEPMQYYYMGYVVLANLILLSGVQSTIAFNLAIPILFALALTTAYAIGRELTGSRAYGLLTGFLVAVAGNLIGFFQFIIMEGDLLGRMARFNYWAASRVIPGTINEFPFFSFLHADVHAHTISIPFQLLYIGLLLLLYRSTKPRAKYLLLGVALGFFYPLNTWEYPTYTLLTIGVVLLKTLDDREIKWIGLGGGIVGLSLLFYLPYILSYSVSRGIGIVSTRTEIIRFIAIFGLFLFLLYSLVLREYMPPLREKMGLAGLVVILGLVGGSVFLHFELLVLLVPLVLLGLYGLYKEEGERRFALLLAVIGGLVALGCEVIYIRDGMGAANPAWRRMNTLFKFYLEVWVLWAIAGGYAAWEYREYLRPPVSRKTWWAAGLLALLIMSSVYPVVATYARSNSFEGEPTLDGMAYVERQHPGEYRAIQYLREIRGQPVVVQAPGNTYEWNTQVSCFTGLPTPIGWAGHEVNWRENGDEVGERMNDVTQIYTAASESRVRELLSKYNASYVYVGPVERERYGGNTAEQFYSLGFEPVFKDEQVVVFRVGT